MNHISQIQPIYKSGTNSTMFTDCCGCAITDYERSCPRCKNKVIGYDADSDSERDRIRWKNATKNWKRY